MKITRLCNWSEKYTTTFRWFFFNQYNNTVLVWVHLLTTLKSNSGWFHSRLIPSYLKVMPELLDLIREIPPCRIKQD